MTTLIDFPEDDAAFAENRLYRRGLRETPLFDGSELPEFSRGVLRAADRFAETMSSATEALARQGREWTEFGENITGLETNEDAWWAGVEAEAQRAQRDARSERAAHTADPETLSLAAQVLGGVAEIGAGAAVGSALGGAAGAATLVGATTGVPAYSDFREEGLSEEEALGAALIEGAGMGAMAALPVAAPGGFLTRAATGAGINVAAGAAYRGSMEAYLTAIGERELAGQYRYDDGVALATDAVLGAAFGGFFGRRAKPGERDPSPEERAAALIHNRQRHRNIISAPGVPLNAAARQWQADVFERAEQQVALGEEIAPLDMPEDARWAPHPDDVSMIAAEIEFSRQTAPLPQSLSDWVIKRGGLRDEGGEVSNLLGAENAREHGRFVSNRRLLSEDGMSLDDAALAAFEDGFFADRVDRPSSNDLIDALREDLFGHRVTADHDAEYVAQNARAILSYYQSIGIDTNLRGGALRAEIARRIAADREEKSVEAFLSTLDGADFHRELGLDAPAIQALRAEIAARSGADEDDGLMFSRSDVRGNASFFDARLTPIQNKVVEMRRNGFTIAEIAEEMEISANYVSGINALARRRGVDVPLARRGGHPGIVTRTMEETARVEQLVAIRQQLMAAGSTRGVHAIIAERLGLSANTVKVRLWRYDRQQEAAARQAKAAADDLTTPDGRAHWASEEAFVEPIPGEALDARQYGFAMESGELVVMSITPEAEARGRASVNWTFADRSIEADPFSKGAERFTLRDLRALTLRVAALLEADMAAHLRGAYHFTRATPSHAHLYRGLFARLGADSTYVKKEIGSEIVLHRPNVAIDRSGLPVADLSGREVRDSLDADQIEAAQRGYIERLRSHAQARRTLRTGGQENAAGGRPSAGRRGGRVGGGDRSISAGGELGDDWKQRGEAFPALAKRTKPGERFSLSERRGAASAEDIRQNLLSHFGSDAQALLDAARVEVVARISELVARLGRSVPDDIKGLYDPSTGKAYLVAENVIRAEAWRTLLHEVGVHAGMKDMLGEALFTRALDAVDALAAAENPVAKAARERVARMVETGAMKVSHAREEALAYLIDAAPDLPIVRRLLARIRQWLWRTFKGAAWLGDLTVDDLSTMAIASLRRQARDARDELRESAATIGEGNEQVLLAARREDYQGANLLASRSFEDLGDILSERRTGRAAGKREPPAQIPDPDTPEYGALIKAARETPPSERTREMRALLEWERTKDEPLFSLPDRDANPVAQALKDEPDMELPEGKAADAIERAQGEEEAAVLLAKGHEAAAACAIQHGLQTGARLASDLAAGHALAAVTSIPIMVVAAPFIASAARAENEPTRLRERMRAYWREEYGDINDVAANDARFPITESAGDVGLEAMDAALESAPAEFDGYAVHPFTNKPLFPPASAVRANIGGPEGAP